MARPRGPGDSAYGIRTFRLNDLHPGDGPRSGWKARIKRFLLDLDSRLDFGLFQSTIWGRELFERFAVFMDRFHIPGWRRWVPIEPLSQLGTLGLAGLLPPLPPRSPPLPRTPD